MILKSGPQRLTMETNRAANLRVIDDYEKEKKTNNW